MRLFLLAVKVCLLIVEQLALSVSRLQVFLYGILPALLPADELSNLIRRYYDRSYQDVEARHPADAYRWILEPWEERVVALHMAPKGSVLVLGAGVGRESIALAGLGYPVIGLDLNLEGLRLASKRAGMNRLPAQFVQGDFLNIPARSQCLDFVLLSGVMFSAIPGRARRRAFLRQLHTLLRPTGKAILNFVVNREPATRTIHLIRTVNRWILRLPWANRDYEPGDSCTNGHFMHAFGDRDELRGEFTSAGAVVEDFDWNDGYAVLTWPASPEGSPRQN